MHGPRNASPFHVMWETKRMPALRAGSSQFTQVPFSFLVPKRYWKGCYDLCPAAAARGSATPVPYTRSGQRKPLVPTTRAVPRLLRFGAIRTFSQFAVFDHCIFSFLRVRLRTARRRAPRPATKNARAPRGFHLILTFFVHEPPLWHDATSAFPSRFPLRRGRATRGVVPLFCPHKATKNARAPRGLHWAFFYFLLCATDTG